MLSSSSSSSSLQRSTFHTPFIMPGIIDLSITMFVIILKLTIAFYPFPSPIIEKLREFFGSTLITISLYILVIFHSLETLIAYIVLKMRGEKDTKTLVKWVVATLIYGHIWLLFK